MRKFLIVLILFFMPITNLAPAIYLAFAGGFLPTINLAPTAYPTLHPIKAPHFTHNTYSMAPGYFACVYSLGAAFASDTRLFPANIEKVFLASISALSKLNYKIEEIQSESGYILFKTKTGEEYLLMVMENGEKAGVKISKMKNSTSVENVKETVMAAISSELQNSFSVVDL